MGLHTETESKPAVPAQPEVKSEDIPENVKAGMSKARAALAGAPNFSNTALPKLVMTDLRDHDYSVSFFPQDRSSVVFDYEEVEGLALMLCRLGYRAMEPLGKDEAEDYLVYISPTFIQELRDAGTRLMPTSAN